MNAYELVIAINPAASQEDRDVVHADIEKLAGKSSIQKYDDMGLVQFSYEMYQKKGLHQGFVSSYYLHIDADAVNEIKQELSYKKNLLRYEFFAMKAAESYFTFGEVQEKVESLIDSDEWTMKKKVVLFQNKENEQYIVRKAVDLLKKFTTRFGDIKPRKYTGVTVSQQKTIRVAIQRARKLGFMPYIR